MLSVTASLWPGFLEQKGPPAVTSHVLILPMDGALFIGALWRNFHQANELVNLVDTPWLEIRQMRLCMFSVETNAMHL